MDLDRRAPCSTTDSARSGYEPGSFRLQREGGENGVIIETPTVWNIFHWTPPQIERLHEVLDELRRGG